MGLTPHNHVERTMTGGQAERLGVKPGMMLIQVGSQPVSSLDEFKEALDARKRAGAATVLVTAEFSTPLKLSSPCQVMKAGEWLTAPAKITNVRKDGTYDVAVFEYVSGAMPHLPQRLEKAFEIKQKAPAEVRAPTPEISNAIAEYEAALATPSLPDSLADYASKYSVDVVRSGDHDKIIRVAVPVDGARWVEEVERRERSTCERILCPERGSRTARIHGAAEANLEAFKKMIRDATGWTDVARLYTRGFELKQFVGIRVLGQASKGLAVVVCGESEEYDRARWAPHAEGKELGRGCCAIT